MQAGEEQLFSTSMGINFEMEVMNTVVSTAYCLMLPTIYGITQLRDLLMLRSGSSRDGGTCKTM